MDFIIINGEIAKRSSARIDIEDRGYQFGDGVYEVVRVYNGKMYTADEHLQRLHQSAEKIGMKIDLSAASLKEMMGELIEKNTLQTGIVYMQFTRGTAPRNHNFPASNVPLTFVAYTKELARPAENMSRGVEAITEEDIRWLRCDIKSLNLLGNLLAKQKAAEAGCFEAILHRGETVTEGSHTNVAIVKNGIIYTHPATNLILNGITRQKALELCSFNGMQAEEEAFSLTDLAEADEVFMMGTTTEIMPIVKINGQPVADGLPGIVTLKLQKLLGDAIIKKCGVI